jgi:hypothetical protein
MAATPNATLLGRSSVTGMVAGAVLGATFMLVLAVLELRSTGLLEVEVVPIAVGAAAIVGAVAGAPVGLVAGMLAKRPLARGNAAVVRAIVAVVAASGAGTTVYLVYGPFGPGEDGARLAVAVGVVMVVAAVTGWILASVLLRPPP